MTVDSGDVGRFALCGAVGREKVVARTYVPAVHHFRRQQGGKGGGVVMLAEPSVLTAGALPFFFVASSFSTAAMGAQESPMVSCRCTMWRLVELFCGEIFSVTAVSTGQKGSISAVSFAPRSTALFTM